MQEYQELNNVDPGTSPFPPAFLKNIAEVGKDQPQEPKKVK